LRSAYRKDPIVSMVVTAGLVNAAIGGFGASWPLATMGIGAAGLAIVLRWWLIQRSLMELPERSAQLYLPPQSSRPSLPTLSTPPKKPIRRS